MPHDPVPQPKTTVEFAFSVLLWLVFVCVSTAGAYNSQGVLVRSVTGNYREGAVRWFEGRDLYSDTVQTGHGVIYWPQSYIMMIPFAYCPGASGEFLWRLIAVGLWGAAILHLAGRMKRCIAGPHYFWFSILAILLSLPAARCGQYTLPLGAAMLFASSALFDKRWNTAALWLFVGLFLKPHIVAIFLLTFVLFGPMRWRLIVAVLLFAAFPFLCQHTEYVVEQYRIYPRILQNVSGTGEIQEFASLYQLAKSCGFEPSSTIWKLLSVSSAFAVLVFCFLLIRRRSEPFFLTVWYFSLPVFFLLLMNTRTENNSYAILTPLLVSYLTMEFRVRKNIALTAFLVLLIVGFIGHYELGKFFLSRGGVCSVCPFLTLVFLIYLGFRVNAWTFADRVVSDTNNNGVPVDALATSRP